MNSTWEQEFAEWLFEYENADIPVENPARIDWENLDYEKLFGETE